MSQGILEPAAASPLVELLAISNGAVASRVLAKSGGGSVTLFAFDKGEGLSEHTTPYDAIVLVVDGRLSLKIGREHVTAGEGEIVRMPANIPHAVDADVASRMLLIMLREPAAPRTA